jgi:hypothetical protein
VGCLRKYKCLTGWEKIIKKEYNLSDPDYVYVGKIIVFVNVGYWEPEGHEERQEESIRGLKERLTQLEKIIAAQQRDIEQLLAGRFPVKISTENEEIKVGDFLTSSPKSGIVMKALEP